MNILLLGSTGFVGRAIRDQLVAHGVNVYCLVRGKPRRIAAEPGGGAINFTAAASGDFATADLTQFIAENEISSVVHAANMFSSSATAVEAEQMLYANFLVPAKVLRSAIEANAGLFVNIASCWQLDSQRALQSVDYVSTKEAFREFLNRRSHQIEGKTIFLNEIFGIGDTREKLLNLAIQAAIEGSRFEVTSLKKILGFTNVRHLSDEIVEVLQLPGSSPGEYIYENYSGITIQEVLLMVEEAAGQLDWYCNSQEPSMLFSSGLSVRGAMPRAALKLELLELVRWKVMTSR